MKLADLLFFPHKVLRFVQSLIAVLENNFGHLFPFKEFLLILTLSIKASWNRTFQGGGDGDCAELAYTPQSGLDMNRQK